MQIRKVAAMFLVGTTLALSSGIMTYADETQSETVAYNEQYPLAGMLDQLGLNFAHSNEMNSDALYWSDTYQKWVNGYDNGPVVIWNQAKTTNNLNYYTTPGTFDEMLAIAKLAGVSVNIPYADEAKAEALANNIREFFNNFPNWKTASDYEKACHIAKWIEQAEYSNDAENSALSYGCLINKQCNCTGYTSAANLLAHCIGLQTITGATDAQNHIYPVFNINSVWFSYDASYNGNEQSFKIYDVYAEADYAINRQAVELGLIDYNVDKPGNTYKYFKDRGYTVPTSLRDKFDASIIGSETDWQGTRDTLKLS